MDPHGHVRRFGATLGASAGLVVFFVLSVSLLAGLLTPTKVLAIAASGVSEVVDVITPGNDDAPSDDGAVAVAAVPAEYMRLYRSAAHGCGMPWQVLAAVGQIETNHGQSTAAGVHSGQNFAGAEGPMQFMPATWEHYGVDGNKDGRKDVYDPADAVPGAAKYLCANGADNPAKVSDALWNYNHDGSYVTAVLAAAQTLGEQAYVLPLPDDAANAGTYGRPHHDYPADDIPVPVGTTVFAVHQGTVRTLDGGACGTGVIIDGTDGVRYTYCHGSSRSVSDGAHVEAGDVIMRSGGRPGDPGAGDSTGPHLHLAMQVGGTNVCPQELLTAWLDGRFVRPQDASSAGCTS